MTKKYLNDINLNGKLTIAGSGGTNGYFLKTDGSGNISWGAQTTYTLPAATSTVLGGIELFSDTAQSVAANAVTTTASRTYGLQVNASGQGVINIPWTDTVYSLPAATSTTLGGVRLFSDTAQSVAANTVSTTASRTYGVQLNASNQAVVNVPWSDTDTNFYPTTFAWTGGGAAGPTGSLTGSGMSAVSYAAIPSASATASGIVTTGAQTFAGAKQFGTFTAATSNVVYGNLSVFDQTGGGAGTLYSEILVQSGSSIEAGTSVIAGTNVYAGNVISLNGKASSVTSQDSGYYMNPAGYILSTRTGGIPFYSHRYGATGTVQMFQFIYNGTNSGTINTTSGGTPAFAAASDYRAKENIQPLTDAIEKMKKAKAYTFNKIEAVDPTLTEQTGFIAHELAEVHPDAVIGEKDAVDENGDPIYQEVMESKLIPVMAQAINDLIGMVESLTARVAALEGN